MGSRAKRDDFSSATKASLAKRSGFQCAICRAVTVGPSAESEDSVSNVGVAAHITAAKSGGPRYDASLTPSERSSISNGIWLCQNHAKLIDDDSVEWTETRLKGTKNRHEKYIKNALGTPQQSGASVIDVHDDNKASTITPNEFAFITARAMNKAYRSVLAPMLLDCGLAEDANIGILMCGTPPEKHGITDYETPWTVFVNADWLQWYLDGQSSGYKADRNIPSELIYGRIPAWPDSFFEFLEAIVLTNATFEWSRHLDGYLQLSQRRQDPDPNKQ